MTSAYDCKQRKVIYDFGEKRTEVWAEQEIVFARWVSDSHCEIFVLMGFLYDAIIGPIRPEEDGWAHLALEYHVYVSDFWWIPKIEKAIEQLRQPSDEEIREYAFGELAVEARGAVVEFLEDAASKGLRVSLERP